MGGEIVVLSEKEGLTVRISKLGEHPLIWIEFEKDGKMESMSMPPAHLYKVIQHWDATCPIEQAPHYPETPEIREQPLQLL